MAGKKKWISIVVVVWIAFFATLGVFLKGELDRRNDSSGVEESQDASDGTTNGNRSANTVNDLDLQIVEAIDPDNPAQNQVRFANLLKALRQGDQYLKEDNIAQASRIFQRLSSVATGKEQSHINFRLAICLEVIGDDSGALDLYRELVTNTANPANPAIAYSAQLAQARIWIGTRRYELAKPVVCGFILREPTASRRFLAEAEHLFAQLTAREAMPTVFDATLEASNIAFPKVNSSAAAILELAGNLEISDPITPDKEQSLVDVTKTSIPTPESTQVSAKLPGTTYLDFIKLLETKTEIPVIWSIKAQKMVSGRRLQIDFEDLSLATVFDQVTSILDLSWSEVETEIHIRSITELSEVELHEFRRDLAERSLHMAIATFPEHGLTANAYLALGNLAFKNGSPEIATGYYQQLLRRYRHARVGIPAVHNLAKTYLRLGNTDKARDTFLRLADEAPGQKYAPIGYLYVGKLLLENGDFRDSIRPLARATSLSEGTDLQRTAALTLALAYLMNHKPHAAILLLAEHLLHLTVG